MAATRSNSVVWQFKRGKRNCEHCAWEPPRRTMLHAHHIVPLICGGADHADNLILLCPNCHAVAHYVCGINRLQRKYVGPESHEQLRAWMRLARRPVALRRARLGALMADTIALVHGLRQQNVSIS